MRGPNYPWEIFVHIIYGIESTQCIDGKAPEENNWKKSLGRYGPFCRAWILRKAAKMIHKITAQNLQSCLKVNEILLCQNVWQLSNKH